MAAREDWPLSRALASGHIRLQGEQPWEDFLSILELMYTWPVQRRRARPLAGHASHDSDTSSTGLVHEIRYLITDKACGVAMPMRNLMPGANTAWDGQHGVLRMVSGRIDALTVRRLATARSIDLLVVFNFNAIAPMVRRALWPARAGDSTDSRAQRSDTLVSIESVVTAALSKRALGACKIGLAPRCRPQLAKAIRQLGRPLAAGAASLPSDYGIAETGSNTIVGIVDFGCDFAHPSFRTGPQLRNSRILEMWDQNDAPGGSAPVVTVNGQTLAYGHGRRFTRADIQDALATSMATGADPYAQLQYDPHANHCSALPPGDSPDAPAGAHGTFVMEIAAGGRRSVGQEPDPPRGVAPDADIVFVHVRPDWHGDRRGLDLNDVLEGIAYIFHVADREQRPCVVNVSLNTMSGPHDGHSDFDLQLSDLLRSSDEGSGACGRAVVIAAGNLPFSRSENCTWQHLRDTASDAPGVTLHWFIAPQDDTLNSIEIWYEPPGAWLQVTLIAPNGDTFGPVKPGCCLPVEFAGLTCGSIQGSRPAPDESAAGAPGTAARQMILIELEIDTAQLQMWHFRVEVAPDTSPPPAPGARVEFDVWLERDDDDPSGLCRHDPPLDVDPCDRACSLGTLSCGQDAIVVGAYDTYNTPAGHWPISANGPNSRGLEKPEISAPGFYMTLVRSRQGFAGCADPLALGQNGTSLAAPFVTGVVACVYQKAPNATLAQIQTALKTTAIRMNGDPSWTPDMGFGMLDPKAVLARF